MKKQVCIHGHFYQPPRENPWLGEIEVQDSAYPFHDWNERITAECYAPNSAARILDKEKNIIDIVNNYSRMSFNFGPTLLSWLERQEPEIYGAILDADQESRKRFSGHGSAIAQPYNHMIMPLADPRDKKTQILWGIEDFIHRFGRQPEGMWLPETAVDLDTMDIMAQQGISFTILSPVQASRYRRMGSRDWSEGGSGAVDPKIPYSVSLPSGKRMVVFL
jgi:alpha-amylase/alpha-mannosidase (GH57 family)